MIKLIKKAIKNPKTAGLYLLEMPLFNFLPDKFYIKLQYYLRTSKILKLNSVQSFNEKLQWLKLYDRNPLYTRLVDKNEVRKYIAEIIGEEYLIPLLGVWDRFEDIDFDKLPNQFVLKCTHDSGGIVICKDFNRLDLEAAREKINKSLKKNYYYHCREWAYKDVKPRIICEKYMEDASEDGLRDYKFMSFNGKVKCSFVCSNRNASTGLNVDFYDNDWNPMPFERFYPRSGHIISKPKAFDKMFEFAEILSKNMIFVRVDFYEINGKLYFGELTFHPGSGYESFTPESYDFLLGSWIELPNQNRKV